MSGVGFLANIKSLTPSIRRRRRCEKHHLELYRDQQQVVPCWDGTAPAPPITPPAAFLMPGGYKRVSAAATVAVAASTVRATITPAATSRKGMSKEGEQNVMFARNRCKGKGGRKIGLCGGERKLYGVLSIPGWTFVN